MAPITKEAVLTQLRHVIDPEFRLNIVDLGLIYEVDITSAADVTVQMTVTTPGCPIIPQFLQQAHDQIAKLEGVGKVNVQLTFNPLWTPAKMSADARAALGLK
jgi:metal-sulfur cluster biosynthetic enzyme